jgi:hypothetical protein
VISVFFVVNSVFRFMKAPPPIVGAFYTDAVFLRIAYAAFRQA